MIDDSYTKSLLHFDGDNESTVFTDESGKVWSLAEGYLNAQLHTADKKFGAASLDIGPNGIYTPTHADWVLGSGDFTFDFWHYNQALYSSAEIKIVQGDLEAFTDFNWIYISGGFIGFFAQRSSLEVASYSYAWSGYAPQTWAHIAIVRHGTDLLLFINGALKTWTDVTTEISTTDLTDLASNVKIIGQYNCDLIDEFRFSKGIARWTDPGGFTPPTEQYGTSGPPPAAMVAVFSLPALQVSFIEKFDTVSELVIPLSVFDVNIHGKTGTIGSIDVTIPTPILNLQSKTGGLAEIDIDLPILKSVLLGAGRLDFSLPKLSLNIHTLSGTVAQLNAILPTIALNVLGHLDGIGTLKIDLPKLLVGMTGKESGLASFAISLPLPEIAIISLTGILSQIDVTLPKLKTNITSFSNNLIAMDIVLPLFWLNIHGIYHPVSVTYKGVTINTKNMAVTEYEGFNFNSMASIQGADFGVNENGIYIIRGKDISESSILTGNFDFGKRVLNIPKNAWINLRSDGKMILMVKSDEGDEYQYEVLAFSDAAHEERVKFGKGLKGRFFSFGLKNIDGNDFDLQKLTVFSESIMSKKR